MNKEDIEESKEFFREIVEQVEACEGLMCPIAFETILEWIDSNDIGKVRTEARRIKFAS